MNLMLKVGSNSRSWW